jgi:hypothetical protein
VKNALEVSFAMLFVFVFVAGCSFNGPQDEASSIITDLSPTSSKDEKMIELIKSHLDILAENDSVYYLDGIDTINSNLFNEIVAFGEDALPFLEWITDRSNKSAGDYRNVSGYEDPNAKIGQRIWAVHAIYAIKPEVYDLSYPSPDGKYTAKLIVDWLGSFFNHGRSFNSIQIIERPANKMIYATEMSHVVGIGGLISPDVNWSADSRFAVIDCCGRRSGSVMAIDIESKNYICLPGAEEMINYAYPEEDADSILLVPRFWFHFEGWESEESVKIGFDVGIIEEDGDFMGWYTYDLAERKTLHTEYSFYN